MWREPEVGDKIILNREFVTRHGAHTFKEGQQYCISKIRDDTYDSEDILINYVPADNKELRSSKYVRVVKKTGAFWLYRKGPPMFDIVGCEVLEDTITASTCLLCGNGGVASFTGFYCTNQKCSNYKR